MGRKIIMKNIFKLMKIFETSAISAYIYSAHTAKGYLAISMQVEKIFLK